MPQLTRPPPGAPDPCLTLTPRMPAILDGEEAVSKWLDFGEVSAQEALKLIGPTENTPSTRCPCEQLLEQHSRVSVPAPPAGPER